MVTMTNTTTVTNEQIARDLHLSDSMVSRIRSGARLPSFDTMALIAQIYNWPVNQQANSRVQGNYGKAFEYIVSRHYVS